MKWIQNCVVLLLASLQLAKVKGQDEGFANFLTLAMQDYPAWVVSSGLEPTPEIPHSINLTKSNGLLNIVGEIKNQRIFNYSNVRIDSVGPNMMEGNFFLEGYLTDIFVVGEYEVSGHIFANIPVDGSGVVEIGADAAHIQLYYEGFAVTADGFVDLSVATGRYWVPPFFHSIRSSFEGLSAGGFEDSVAEAILATYQEGHVKEAWFPVVQHVQQYLTEQFAKTPLSEIIGTTLRPPTTTTTSTPTPEPTCPPCFTCPDFEITCPPPTECETCPPEPTCPPMETEAPCEPCHTTLSPSTCPPPSGSAGPRFSRAIYQTSLPAWPTQGFEMDLGIRASSPDGSPLRFELVTSFPFVRLTEDQHISFTMDIAEGAYVGPNNVMVLEVLVEEVDDPTRSGAAAVIIVFPRGSATDEN